MSFFITFAISSISLFVNVIPESTRLLLRVLYPASKRSFGMLIIALRGSFVGDFLNEFLNVSGTKPSGLSSQDLQHMFHQVLKKEVLLTVSS